MAKIAASALFWAAVLDVVVAGPAAEPMVTPAPLLRRQAGTQNFIGYYQYGASGSNTICKYCGHLKFSRHQSFEKL